jgi:hypothetical protein
LLQRVKNINLNIFRQSDWKEVISRFNKGLLDLEFLNDEKGRRIAAFGITAGIIYFLNIRICWNGIRFISLVS